MSQDLPDKKLADRTLMGLSLLVAGTTCCDMTNPEFDFLDDIAGDGLVVDRKRMVPVWPEWLELKANSYAMGGGSLNIAPLVSLSGAKAGILTSLGKEKGRYDIHGRFMMNIMEKTGTIPLIIPHSRLPSAASFIKPSPEGRREAILHAANAVDDLDLENKEILDTINQLPHGAIIHYVYSGAAKTMDSEGGKKLGRVMQNLKQSGYITIVDPHTLSKNPQDSIRRGEIIEGYNLLKPVLPHLSWFFASEAEAMMIANALGFFSQHVSQEERNCRFLYKMADDYCTDTSSRILGITAGTLAYILYIHPGGKRVGPIPVESQYIIVDADKFIGAGDSFRAGFEVEWIMGRDYPEKFRRGGISEEDLERLCHAGHLMAACYVTRTPSDQYGNIPLYRDMIKVIDSGRVYSNKDSLLSNLNKKQSQPKSKDSRKSD